MINHLNQKHDIHFDKNEIDQIEKPSVKDEVSFEDDLMEEYSLKDQQGLNQCYQLAAATHCKFCVNLILVLKALIPRNSF